MNIVEFGFGAQQAVDQPRFVSTTFPPSTYPHQVANTLQMKSGFPDEAVGKLRARGHEVVVGERIFGSANVIIAAEDGRERPRVRADSMSAPEQPTCPTALPRPRTSPLTQP
jgi:gamma-glutamyltranspeptidase